MMNSRFGPAGYFLALFLSVGVVAADQSSFGDAPGISRILGDKAFPLFGPNKRAVASKRRPWRERRSGPAAFKTQQASEGSPLPPLTRRPKIALPRGAEEMVRGYDTIMQAADARGVELPTWRSFAAVVERCRQQTSQREAP